jgi:hypothetical protein
VNVLFIGLLIDFISLTKTSIEENPCEVGPFSQVYKKSLLTLREVLMRLSLRWTNAKNNL